MSQFEPQSAGLGPNGKLGSMYGGMYNIISFKSLLTQENSALFTKSPQKRNIEHAFIA